MKEDGVRNLKKKLEDVISLYNLKNNINDKNLFYKISGIKYDKFTDDLSKELIDMILKSKQKEDLISHLYI